MYDIAIIGGGISALSLLMHLSEEYKVLLVHNGRKTSSLMAQGGISTSIFEASIDAHVMDTYHAGHCEGDIDAIRKLITRGNSVIEQMIERGINFEKNASGDYSLHLEGAHSRPRILHYKDYTGRFVTEWMKTQIKADVTVLTGQLIDMNCDEKGVSSITVTNDHHTYHVAIRQVVLATGGYSGIFKHATNNSESGVIPLMLARQCGCTFKDLSYIQYHPTLYIQNDTFVSLISEAVRGSGARIVDESGRHIMEYHPYKSLAARDVVSRQMYVAAQKGHQLFLDIRMIDNFQEKFPDIARVLQPHHKTFIPVTPGAHFVMGGITTDVYGSTGVNGLYVIGEAANTGFHGKNRLASNALLEGLAMGSLLSEKLVPSKTGFVTHRTEPESVPDFMYKKEVSDILGIERDDITLEKGIHFFKTLNENEANHLSRLYNAFVIEAMKDAQVKQNEALITNEGAAL